jgi:hypothetical protein
MGPHNKAAALLQYIKDNNPGHSRSYVKYMGTKGTCMHCIDAPARANQKCATTVQALMVCVRGAVCMSPAPAYWTSLLDMQLEQRLAESLLFTLNIATTRQNAAPHPHIQAACQRPKTSRHPLIEKPR